MFPLSHYSTVQSRVQYVVTEGHEGTLQYSSVQYSTVQYSVSSTICGDRETIHHGEGTLQ